MISREVAGRYRGSYLGLFWAILNPLMMLVAYTFAFNVVFNARWPGGAGGHSEFAVAVFIGMITFGFFAECVARSPTLIVSNANYVKKVVFPLEILVPVSIGTGLFNWVLGLAAWLVVYTLTGAPLRWTVMLVPLTLLPLLLLVAGLGWFLAALGVYLRDISQAVGFLTTFLMFVSPVFYPVSAVPEAFQPILALNPVAVAIEQARDVLISGQTPDWLVTGKCLALGASILCLGFAWFQKARKGFGDVL
jgi:lipopolysaccharide transport system permease protein